MTRLKIAAALAAALVLAGCLISGTFSIQVQFVEVDTDFVDGVVKETVNLSDKDDTWKDHADKIEQIEKINLDAIVQNDLSTSDELNVYLSDSSTYATKSQVEAAADAGAAYPVLLGFKPRPGPGQLDTLTVLEAQALLQLSGANFANIKKLLKTGQFTVYITSTGATAQGKIKKANIYIVFTASE